MENADDDTSACEWDAPPPWLKKYLSKMKNEIKAEIVEELASAIHSDGHSTKSTPAVKFADHTSHIQGTVVHEGIFCDNCDQLIHGIRYKCGNCLNFDLCQECESLPNIHNKNHVFLKIRFPVALKLYQMQKLQELVSHSLGKVRTSSGKNRQSKKLYEAKFVCDETIPDGTVLAPSTGFVKSWRVVNSGTRVWTHTTKLHLIQGSADLAPDSSIVDVPPLKPEEEGIVSVHFSSPPTPGIYRSHWNFCHKSRPFGDIVWCHVRVRAANQGSPGDGPKPIAAKDLSFSPASSSCSSQEEQVLENKASEISCVAQVLAAVKEHGKGNAPRKLAVTSHTATPTNTPFDLSPPKSPDHHQTAFKENRGFKELLFKVKSDPSDQANESDIDDECSIVSLSSDSETEFVVIPMPKCFNFTESFSSEEVVLNNQTPIGEKHNAGVDPAPKAISQETGVPEHWETTTCGKTQRQEDQLQILFEQMGGSDMSVLKSEEDLPIQDYPKPEISVTVTTFDKTHTEQPAPQSCDQEAAVQRLFQKFKRSPAGLAECQPEPPVLDYSRPDRSVVPTFDGPQHQEDDDDLHPCYRFEWIAMDERRPQTSRFSAKPLDRSEAEPPVLDYSKPEVSIAMTTGKKTQQQQHNSVDPVHEEFRCTRQNCMTRWSKKDGGGKSAAVEDPKADVAVATSKKTQQQHAFDKEVMLRRHGHSIKRWAKEEGSGGVRSVKTRGGSASLEDLKAEVSVTVTTSEAAETGAGEKVEVTLESKVEEEQNVEHHNSATFPKFPVEGVTSAFDPTPSCNEERAVPVLPEGLVNGTLSVAASVFNTARGIISTIQNPRVQQGQCLSQTLPYEQRRGAHPPAAHQPPDKMEQLVEMGFCDRQLNSRLLQKHRGDLPRIVAELVAMSDNDWHAARHRTPPAAFD